MFLKKFFEDGSFAASGIEESALPLQDKLASLGVKFHAREITFSEFIARHG
ncbi:hypothetical protein [Campylobacter showae]|uniref:hypothetical protein n=1 Tax=Campylobacter showae TaxID=204 RepID=UPI0028D5F20F|nr:hypothetical protein [Campylobacter showae]